MSQVLSRSKRAVGLIIAGIVALIVNHLAKNVTNALSNQEDLDRHLEQWIDVLYI